jgi:hypothetical protein
MALLVISINEKLGNIYKIQMMAILKEKKNY